MGFAARLHTVFHHSAPSMELPNRKMRQLNQEHIFVYPYLKENGLDLDVVLPGLGEIGESFTLDKALKNKIKELGDRYLADGKTLLHGDYFPGSWLRTDRGLRIIDPEFCYFGEPEFEIGVTLAHLKMVGQARAIVDKALSLYRDRVPLEEGLCLQYIMATEMIRRVLGLAQLPLQSTLKEREDLLLEARSILM